MPEQVTLSLPGYEQFWYSAEKPGYSGTAIFSKPKPIQVVNGFPQNIIKEFGVSGDVYGDPNLEGRVIAAEFEKFWVVGVYTPNTKDDLSRLELRHKHWDPAFFPAYCQQLEKNKPVVFCGDLNVAHTELDLANPLAPTVVRRVLPTKSAPAFKPMLITASLIHYDYSSKVMVFIPLVDTLCQCPSSERRLAD